MTKRWAAPAAFLFASLAAPAAAVEVRFEINDAHIRDRPVAGARIVAAPRPGAEATAESVTDEAGVAVLDLDPGTWWISYGRAGYVPIRESETEIRAAGQVITTTLSMMLEAEGGAGRRIRMVLNWGSDSRDVRDVDGHAECACGQADTHVFFAAMRHEHQGHALHLDVDDTDWGGPETITFVDPPPGAYSYRVHQYSQDRDSLGSSDVVVRVFFDDRLEAELRAPSSADRHWRPFKQLVVEADLTPRLVAFEPAEVAAGAPLEPPATPYAEQDGGDGLRTCLAALGVLVLFAFIALLLLVRHRRSARRAK